MPEEELCEHGNDEYDCYECDPYADCTCCFCNCQCGLDDLEDFDDV